MYKHRKRLYSYWMIEDEHENKVSIWQVLPYTGRKVDDWDDMTMKFIYETGQEHSPEIGLSFPYSSKSIKPPVWTPIRKADIPILILKYST